MQPMKPRPGIAKLILATVLSLLTPYLAAACSVCYGEPDSPASRGLTWAIIALALVVGVVLSGVVMFFVQANRNSANREKAIEGEN